MRKSGTRNGDLARGIAVLAAAVLQFAFGALGGTGALGTSVGDVANAHPHPLLPPGGAFMIWNLIYLATLAYAIWQLLPSQRERPVHRLSGWWLVAVGVLNAAWIVVFGRSWIALSEVVIVVLLAVLAMAWRAVATAGPAASPADRILLYGAVSLYTGWVTVATVVGALTTYTAANSSAPGGAAVWTAWGVAALLIAAGLFLGRGVLGFAAAAVWALTWVATVADGGLRIAVAALAVAVVLVVAVG
ncbi:MAG TPA: tryptophan-rich sensory protein, partial [Phytomonospora sp.]